jgi:hypothetical protein
MKQNTPSANKTNPYNDFKTWLFDGNLNSELDYWIISAVQPRFVLSMFGQLDSVTVYINDLLNNYNIHTLDRLELYKFFKEIVIRKNIKIFQLNIGVKKVILDILLYLLFVLK